MNLNDEAIFAATARNRRSIADMLERLTPVQWATDSLCEGWTVQHVAAHLLQHVFVGFGQFVLLSLRYRGNTDAVVNHVAARLAKHDRTEIVRLLREHADDRVNPPRVGPWGPFADTCVHLRDIARPLGLANDVPTEDWVALLGYLTSPSAARSLAPPERVEHLSLQPTDADGHFGHGLVISGRAEALVMAVTGRAAALADLSGPGVDLLRERIAR